MSVANEPGTEVAVQAVEAAVDGLARVKDAVAMVVYGQERVVEESLVTLLAGGHGLLVGVPGLAKTRLVETLGVVLGLSQKRVQFTPDLMPSDVLGSEVLDEAADGRRAFRFIRGPVFAQLLMADEINRASPRTQAALLQAMQERKVTVAGEDHDLPRPFHVLATQNPVEQEGTYPLPEAQLDRFLLQIDVDYPSEAAERRMVLVTTGGTEATAPAIADPRLLDQWQRLVRRLPIGDQVVDAILKLVRAARPGSGALPDLDRLLAWGAGPRASQALALAVRAKALLDGRIAPSLDDVRALAGPVMRHRIAPSFAARAEGIDADELIRRLLAHAL
ncbi:AAA family ATPase [Geminicoccus harenae]|uniref:AAA family ATPase n=2 Tax=Geminicoccus harenae TaxID=2498453 RepID=UPI001C946F6B|nr:MoxR family ATPase [Geminicoccus harenae]